MYGRIYIEDIDVVKMFVNECKECLEGLEKEILKLEANTKDSELQSYILRRVHRIKMGSSFTGLWGITRLCNEIEFMLDAIGNGRATVDTGLIDSLLMFVDFINGYIKDLDEKLIQWISSDENDLKYLEFDNVQKEEQMLENLKQAYENCKVSDGENSKFIKKALEESDLDVLQSEKFKKDLAEGLREQFLLENAEHIDRIENDLLMRLDANSEDKEAADEIFRAVHSIKGGTGIYLATISAENPLHTSLKKFSEVVHAFENLLALIRDRRCKFESKLVDLSFSVMDYLKSLMNSIASEESIDFDNNSVFDGIREHISRIQSSSGDMMQKVPMTNQQQLGKTDDVKSKTNGTQSIRVNQEKIDIMMNMISELLIAKNSFMHISTKLNVEYDLPEMAKEVKQVGAYVNKISDELQNAIMSIRMVEIKTIFQRMPRVVRDIAQSTGKKMELYMEGENTEIDKTIIEQISDPLVHLIRNAADHGIEPPEERLSKGKPETGRIVLRAYNKNKHVFIEIEDDGKGIDAEKLKEKAIEKGFITLVDAERMSHDQLLNLIFLPGFSTAKQITEISGRGVGMDIVKSNIAKISGNIMIESKVDEGTKMIVQLPLSLAVSRGLIVEVSGETYIIPLEYIVETVKINKNSIHKYNGKCFVYLRGNVIRVEWLSKIFLIGDRDTEKEELNAVILSNGVENFAIVVDKLKNEQEFVVKTLEGHLAAIPGISGSTLLGNGQVVLIINPVDVLQLVEK
ncbi:chemotaxis protein CheA [Lutispora thermophila]|uniref:histidine kinase n=1 Tax=Lutispora thermophila DSM 19022 TaxID=1122184 RepID=A0A1M6EJF0_9FIRM|nr:chemotaxis protein CheA [Lutispora thermophila]SHI85569.1 two-component system, chemotaxis family, sensor kinase CheA [Lutispora thermophila DSM 19022]